MKSGKPRHLPSVCDLRQTFQYDEQTGNLVWLRLPKKTTRAKVGTVAGTYDGRYVYVTLNGTRVAAHRVVLALATGEWPTSPQVDHLDGDGQNNRLSNLRAATASVNQQNQRRAQRSSSTGLLGVVPVPSRRSPLKFRAQIWVDGRAKNLGYFLTPELAHGAYIKAKREMHLGNRL